LCNKDVDISIKEYYRVKCLVTRNCCQCQINVWLTSMFAEQEIISFEIVDRGFDRQSGQTRDY